GSIGESLAEELDYRHPRDLLRVLECQEQVHLGTLRRGLLGDVLALVEDATLRDVVAGMTHQHVGESRLARPVWSHQGDDVTLLDGQIDAFEDGCPVGFGVEVLDLKKRSTHNTHGTGTVGGIGNPRNKKARCRGPSGSGALGGAGCRLDRAVATS